MGRWECLPRHAVIVRQLQSTTPDGHSISAISRLVRDREQQRVMDWDSASAYL